MQDLSLNKWIHGERHVAAFTVRQTIMLHFVVGLWTRSASGVYLADDFTDFLMVWVESWQFFVLPKDECRRHQRARQVWVSRRQS